MAEMQDSGTAEGPQTRRSRVARWKKVLLVLSVVLMVVGLGLQGYGCLRRSPATAPAPRRSGGLKISQGLLPHTPQGDGPAAEATKPAEDWYPVAFRLGFSFFAGFCIAYALRAFLKLTLLAIGLVLLLLLGLQYAGVIEVDFSAMGEHYDTAVGWLRTQVTSFHQFVTGYLPSSATAGLGLFAGFRRR